MQGSQRLIRAEVHARDAPGQCFALPPHCTRWATQAALARPVGSARWRNDRDRTQLADRPIVGGGAGAPGRPDRDGRTKGAWQRVRRSDRPDSGFKSLSETHISHQALAPTESPVWQWFSGYDGPLTCPDVRMSEVVPRSPEAAVPRMSANCCRTREGGCGVLRQSQACRPSVSEEGASRSERECAPAWRERSIDRGRRRRPTEIRRAGLGEPSQAAAPWGVTSWQLPVDPVICYAKRVWHPSVRDGG